MDTEPANTSPEALSEFIGGVEEKTRGDGEHHVAILCTDGSCVAPEENENEFASQEALNEWADTLPPQDSVVVVKYESEAPDPDHK